MLKTVEKCPNLVFGAFLSAEMSATIYSITASRAIRTSSAVEYHQEPFSFPSGFTESPTAASAEGASFPFNFVAEYGIEHSKVMTQI